MVRLSSALFVPVLLLGLNGCRSPSTALISLADSSEPLRARFNADADRPRLVALFSPL